MPEHTPSVSVVVPALNEARNLEIVLPALPPVHEVIVVDGGSLDDTVETVRRVMPHAVLLQQTRRGKGNALICGFQAATGDIVVMFDADGSADPAEIPAFVAALVAGADFAKGSRFCRGPAGLGSSDDITLLRQVGNAGLNLLANVLFGTRFTDLCYGYNAFWRRLLPVLDLPPAHTAPGGSQEMVWGDGFEIESVLSCRVAAAGLRVTEVPSRERARAFGETNLRTFADGARVLRTILAERSAASGRTDVVDAVEREQVERDLAIAVPAEQVPQQRFPVEARPEQRLVHVDWGDLDPSRQRAVAAGPLHGSPEVALPVAQVDGTAV